MIKPTLRKRLDKLEGSFKPNQCWVLLVSEPDDTDEEIDRKIARWRAGKIVRGIDSTIEDRTNTKVIVVTFVSPKNQAEPA